MVEGYLVRVDPATNAVTRVDLYTPEQRARLERTSGITEETAGVNLETARANLERSRMLADPVAEYQRQVQLTQQQATAYRDQLNDKVLRGEVTVEDASTQFDRWWDGNVEAKLTPYQTMAEGAYRKEQNEYLQAQAAGAGQAWRPSTDKGRSWATRRGRRRGTTSTPWPPRPGRPEFLAQLAQNVSRIGQPLPGGPSQHSGGMQFSPESLSLENVRRNMPNLTEVGNQAVARALSRISPAAAQQIGVAPPKPPGLPTSRPSPASAPFSIPNPHCPVPGREARGPGQSRQRRGAGVTGAAGLRRDPVPGWAGRRPPWQIPA